MKVHFDQDSDAVYFKLDDSAITDSEEVKPGVILDFNEENQVVGIKTRGYSGGTRLWCGDGARTRHSYFNRKCGVKFKRDENLGRSALEVLTLAGHDVDTVLQEGLSGTDYDHLFEVYQTEQRALITLDRDFGQTLRFPPTQSLGIAILELPPRLHPQSIVARLRELLVLPATRSIQKELWIVEPWRILIHNPAQQA